MASPVRTLPVVQNWDCHTCGDCCKTYKVRLTAADRALLKLQDWAADPAVGRDPVERDRATGEHQLAHTADGDCVLLGPDNRCRAHAKFGPAAKPMACRLYPFVLVPAGDHWRAGVRLACPSAAANLGPPVAARGADLAACAVLVEADAEVGPADLRPPPLGDGQPMGWPDLLRLVGAVDGLLAESAGSAELKARRVAAFAAVMRTAKFDKVSGKKLGLLADAVAAAVRADVPADPWAVPPPGWVGRTLFRQLAAVYCRKDHGPGAGAARRGRLTRVRSAWRFAVGAGPVPKLHAGIPDVTFADADRPAGPLPADADALVTRYLRVKVGSAQFCGPANFGLPVWAGLTAVLATVPVVLWLARVLAGPRPVGSPLPAAAVERAVRMADDNFGYNPLLGGRRLGWVYRTLADRDELSRLIAWYAR